jgi:hypothetical protein
MRSAWSVVVAGLGVALCAGCASSRMAYEAVAERGAARGGVESSDLRKDRMLIWKASLSVEVAAVSNAVAEAGRIVTAAGGFVERQSGSGENRAQLTLRVPASALRASMGVLEALGRVTDRSISSSDVTEQYVDVEARLKNKAALRDRLKQLLDKAQDVKDVLAIEAELSRVQSDIDSMEARMKSLRGQVDMASIDLALQRRKILGPVGYAFKALWWGVGKLFVIRD